MRENSRYHEAENHTGQDNSHTLVIEGRNAVLEAFRSGKPIDKYLYWMDVRMVR